MCIRDRITYSNSTYKNSPNNSRTISLVISVHSLQVIKRGFKKNYNSKQLYICTAKISKMVKTKLSVLPDCCYTDLTSTLFMVYTRIALFIPMGNFLILTLTFGY